MDNEQIENREYTTPEIAKILDIPQRKVISMLERGYFRPSIQEANGHASKRLFGFEDVAVAYVIWELLEFGLSVEKLRFAGQVLVSGYIWENYFFFDKHESWAPPGRTRKDEDAFLLDFARYPAFLDDPSPALFLPLKEMRAALREKIRNSL